MLAQMSRLGLATNLPGLFGLCLFFPAHLSTQTWEGCREQGLFCTLGSSGQKHHLQGPLLDTESLCPRLFPSILKSWLHGLNCLLGQGSEPPEATFRSWLADWVTKSLCPSPKPGLFINSSWDHPARPQSRHPSPAVNPSLLLGGQDSGPDDFVWVPRESWRALLLYLPPHLSWGHHTGGSPALWLGAVLAGWSSGTWLGDWLQGDVQQSVSWPSCLTVVGNWGLKGNIKQTNRKTDLLLCFLVALVQTW